MAIVCTIHPATSTPTTTHRIQGGDTTASWLLASATTVASNVERPSLLRPATPGAGDAFCDPDCANSITPRPEYKVGYEGGPKTAIDGAEIKARYGRRLTGTARGAQYLGVATMWFRVGRRPLFGGVKPREEDVRAFVLRRRADGLSDSTIDWELRAVRAMYRGVGVELPMRAAALRVTTHSVAFGADVILRLIECAHGLSPRDRAWVALSTVYGPRVSEIGHMTPEFVDLRGRRVMIPTAKGGVRRWQRIPDAVAWALRIPWQPCSNVGGGSRFHRIMAQAGMPQRKGAGWHYLRRGLVVALQRAGAAGPAVSAFMRWSKPQRRGDDEASSMLDIYGNPSEVVGLRGRERPADQQDRDDLVWAVHPFVDAWRQQ